jgi:hypothetical protein
MKFWCYDNDGLPWLDTAESVDSKERRLNAKTLRILLLWLGSKARIRRILALYVFLITVSKWM